MNLYLNVGCGKDIKTSTDHHKWVNIDVNPDIKDVIHRSIFELGTIYNGTADMVLAQDVIEHTHDPELAIKNIYDALRSNGETQIQTPDPYALFDQLKDGIIDEEEYNRLVFSNEPFSIYERHFHLISVGRLQRMMEKIGFEIVSKKRLNICAIVIGRKK